MADGNKPRDGANRTRFNHKKLGELVDYHKYYD
ncbi:hypothetical protein F444_15253 [Phytophthora nicotianae P1976]|uniref:Uncharacterized protein n=1 Tax=Phytophthora nicotianae P1976 TaxID=1317066 RepID=A0A080ZMK2_PHYNI|nr:hypothetical protein F444_15253 [Phytophthora nicotianae P1976]